MTKLQACNALLTAKSYVILAQSMRSNYYLYKAKKSLDLVQVYLRTNECDKTITMLFKLVA